MSFVIKHTARHITHGTLVSQSVPYVRASPGGGTRGCWRCGLVCLVLCQSFRCARPAEPVCPGIAFCLEWFDGRNACEGNLDGTEAAALMDPTKGRGFIVCYWYSVSSDTTVCQTCEIPRQRDRQSVSRVMSVALSTIALEVDSRGAAGRHIECNSLLGAPLSITPPSKGSQLPPFIAFSSTIPPAAFPSPWDFSFGAPRKRVRQAGNVEEEGEMHSQITRNYKKFTGHASA